MQKKKNIYNTIILSIRCPWPSRRWCLDQCPSWNLSLTAPHLTPSYRRCPPVLPVCLARMRSCAGRPRRLDGACTSFIL